jgi:hypothetical protein
VALVFVGGDGSVRANNFFGLAFDGGAKGDVLADGEAEDVGLAREFEAVAALISKYHIIWEMYIHGGVVR